MSTLLVQACSKTKNHVPGTAPALELYSGFFFKIIKKAMREGAFDANIDICILSAEYGLLDATTKIEWYDRRMDAARAAELAPSVQDALMTRATDYDRIIINIGQTYAHALGDVARQIDADVYHINGAGIGEKGRTLKRAIRTDETGATLQPIASSVKEEA